MYVPKVTALAAGALKPFRAHLTRAAQCYVHLAVLALVPEESARVSVGSTEQSSGRAL